MNESYYDNCALKIMGAFSFLQSSCESAILNDYSRPRKISGVKSCFIKKATLRVAQDNTPPVDMRLIHKVFQ